MALCDFGYVFRRTIAASEHKPIIDYLIVIPLDEEFRYIRDVIGPVLSRSSLRALTIGSHFYALTQLPTAAANATAVLLSVGRMGEAPVQSAVEAAVKEWRPATVLLVGIAGSLEPERVKLGDVFGLRARCSATRRRKPRWSTECSKRSTDRQATG